MKRLTIIVLALAACTAKTENTTEATPEEVVVEKEDKPSLPGLYMITRTAVNGEKKDSTWLYQDTYFETTLAEYSTKENPEVYFLKASVKASDALQWETVADSTGLEMHFTSSTEFLNYMSKRGFDMVDQKKRQYATDYTFKRTSP